MGKRLIIIGADFRENGIKGEIPVSYKNYIYNTNASSWIDLLKGANLSGTNTIGKVEIVCKFMSGTLEGTGSNRVMGIGNAFSLIPLNTSSLVNRVNGVVAGATLRGNENGSINIYEDNTYTLEDMGAFSLDSYKINGVSATSSTNTAYNTANYTQLPLLAGRASSGDVTSKVPGCVKVKSVKIYNTLGTLVSDYAPAVDAEGKPSLYDKKNKVFLYAENNETGIAVE